MPAETQEDAELWAKEMAKDMPKTEDARDKIERAGYDIEKRAHLLTDIYDTLLSDKK